MFVSSVRQRPRVCFISNLIALISQRHLLSSFASLCKPVCKLWSTVSEPITTPPFTTVVCSILGWGCGISELISDSFLNPSSVAGAFRRRRRSLQNFQFIFGRLIIFICLTGEDGLSVYRDRSCRPLEKFFSLTHELRGTP